MEDKLGSSHRCKARARRGVALAVCNGNAYALDSCTGHYSATLLKPLAQPAIVAIDLADSSDVSARLGAAFTNGMQAAGVAVTGTPSVTLRLSYQVTGQGGGGTGGGGLNQGGGAVTGWSSWSGGDAASLQGGQTLALPGFPNYDAFAPQQPVQSALLMLRVEARNLYDSPNWVAMLQCTLAGTDNQALAYQLGYLIGGAIGQQRDNAPV